MDQINTFLSNTMKNFDNLMLNPYFATVITIILSVYAALASPKLPNFLKKLFDNSIFKVLIISFIAYRANKNPQLSLLIAICFVVTLNFLAEKENKEAFEQIETFNQLEYFSNALDMDTNIQPMSESNYSYINESISNSDSNYSSSNNSELLKNSFELPVNNLILSNDTNSVSQNSDTNSVSQNSDTNSVSQNSDTNSVSQNSDIVKLLVNAPIPILSKDSVELPVNAPVELPVNAPIPIPILLKENNSDSQNSNSQNSDSQNSNSQNSDSQNSNSQNSDSQNSNTNSI